jgi:hypothetical protein
LRRAEGGANNFGVFRVKNFTAITNNVKCHANGLSKLKYT